ncbi:MAG: GNAT family N-acetyltransferase [Clostridium butyricum]|nr:GNAT family N-acetyltransferase [Clostridium butyricum]
MNFKLLSINDYDELYNLWVRTPGMGMRSLDDSKEGIEKFIKRNPNTNFICLKDNKLVGSILCGHDGRRAYIYHTCVDSEYRGLGIAKTLIAKVSDVLKEEGINKVALVCFKTNELGNTFWRKLNYEKREDLNYYNISLNQNNN